MKRHALLIIFEKSSKTWNCRLLQIIGGALSVKTVINELGLFSHELVANPDMGLDFAGGDQIDALNPARKRSD